MLARLQEMVEAALGAGDAGEACSRFFNAVEPLGASYFQARVYRRPEAPLTSENHHAAGGRVFAVAPPDWLVSDAGRYICFQNNPLLTPIRENRTRYAFSDFAPKSDPGFGQYWEALQEAAIDEAICATSYGEGNRIASVHLGFLGREFMPAEQLVLQVAELALTERLLALVEPPAADPSPLTPRERDAIAYVAQGKTDWEISVIFGVSEATARFHVDNARRKLDAVNRAHAVAKVVARRIV